MTSPEIQTARELATHAADISHLQEDIDRMAKDMAEIKATLNSISNTLAEAKGGWKVLMMFGGAGGVVGAMLTQIIHAIPGGK